MAARISVPQAIGLAGLSRPLYEAITSFIAQVNGILDAQPSGRTTLVGGTVTVRNARVTQTSEIAVWCETAGGTQGFLSTPTTTGARANNKYFTIQSSSATDTSVVGWKIMG